MEENFGLYLIKKFPRFGQRAEYGGFFSVKNVHRLVYSVNIFRQKLYHTIVIYASVCT